MTTVLRRAGFRVMRHAGTGMVRSSTYTDIIRRYWRILLQGILPNRILYARKKIISLSCHQARKYIAEIISEAGISDCRNPGITDS
ncbi:MAG: hypothetical protein ACYC1T_04295 [Sulfuricaulis sp.]